MNIENHVLEKLALATDGALWNRDYGWMCEISVTRNTISDFIIASEQEWKEATEKKSGSLAGFHFVAWERVRSRRGQQRCALSVLDIGEFRIAINADLTERKFKSGWWEAKLGK